MVIVLKVQDNRRKSRITPRKVAGKYCRSLENMGFTEDDYKLNSRDYGSVYSNEHEDNAEGSNSIEFYFIMDRYSNLFRYHFRPYFAESIECECIQWLFRHKCENPTLQGCHSC